MKQRHTKCSLLPSGRPLEERAKLCLQDVPYGENNVYYAKLPLLLSIGAPDISVHVARRNVSNGESATLTCEVLSLNGPRRQAFEWEKNSRVLANSTGNHSTLVVSTVDAGSPYGEYGCRVNNGLLEQRATVLLSEKGTQTWN